MQTNIDTEYERYKDWDFSNAKHTTNPKILELRARKREYDSQVSACLDKDVAEILTTHNSAEDRLRMNNVIRALFSNQLMKA